MRVVYLDTVFLFNFAVNRLLLEGTRRILRAPPAPRRLTSGAAVGALYAVLCTLPLPPLLRSAPLRLLSGALMVGLAFGGQGRGAALRGCLTFFTLSAATGGGVLGLYYLIGNGSDFVLTGPIAWLNLSPAAFLLFFALAYPIAARLLRTLPAETAAASQLLSVTLTVAGHTVRCQALADTGCHLREPLSGLPVVIAEQRLFDTLPPPSTAVPFATLSGEGTLPALRGSLLQMESGGETRCCHDFYVALSPTPLSDDFSLILPHTLLAFAPPIQTEKAAPHSRHKGGSTP
ncbi:MAG: sigma-E processing peptidase SpoIIGA [Clostridia bacterium]|nr:sigma-E processing peptidase SpoIIGA [Clostridia bacterium]